MKKLITIIALTAAMVLSVNAQTTNTINVSDNLDSVATLNVTNVPDANPQGYELTLGGGGFTTPNNGESQFGLDVSLSTNPFESVRDLWFGMEQIVSWEPTFAGYTDLFAEWSINIYNEVLYLNPGWDVGVSYATQGTAIWNTGPHACLQYYTSETAFIYGQVNYVLPSEGNAGLEYSIGIGISF